MAITCPHCRQPARKRSGTITVEQVTRTATQRRRRTAYRCMKDHRFTANGDISRFTNSFIEYVVTLYLHGLSLNDTVTCVRLQFEQDLLSKPTLIDFLETVADQLPGLRELDDLLHPWRSGYLAVDGVFFKYRSLSFGILFGFDPVTFDVVHYRLALTEGKAQWSTFLTELHQYYRLKQTKVKGLYLDGQKYLVPASKQVFPDVPRQLCIVHKLIRMGQKVPIKSLKRSRKLTQRQKQLIRSFKRRFEAVIFAETKQESKERLVSLKQWANDHPDERFQKALNGLKRHFALTLTHFDYPDMERDNNLIECFNSVISRRLDLLKGFKKPKNIERYLKLLLLDYRFRPLKEGRVSAGRKGKSPLELARVGVPKTYNWIKYLRESLNLDFRS